LADRVVVMNKGKIQQVGSPSEIYETPSNTFVASFIGSPAMNLITGKLLNGSFSTDGILINGLTEDKEGDVILGFRAEDAAVVDQKSELNAEVYSFELLGDATMVTVKANNQLISIKANKDYRVKIGQSINISVPVKKCHLFDVKTGTVFNKKGG